MKKYIMQMNALKRKKANINELELITDCEGINDNDSTYCLFDETLSNFDS